MKIAPSLFVVASALTLSLSLATGALASEGHGNNEKIDKEYFNNKAVYVNLAPMVIPVIYEDGVEQLVSLMLTVHVKDTEASIFLQKNLPRVTDSLYSHLYGSLGTSPGLKKRSRQLNLGKIKRRSIDAVSTVIGRDNVINVLIRGVSQRML